MEGSGDHRGECEDRSRAHVSIDTAEGKRVKFHGISKREERHDDIRSTCKLEV